MKTKSTTLASVFLAASAIHPVFACDESHNEGLSRLATICEAKIKARLKAPATYQRAKVGEYSFQMTAAEYKDRELTKMRDAGLDGDAWRDAYKKLDSDLAAIESSPTAAPYILEARISYDAQNSFGALLRGNAVCQFVSPDGNKDAVDELAVTIEMDRT